MIDKLIKVQQELKAPKGQSNDFGGYKYRSCEDILEAVKPLLIEQGLFMVISDDIISNEQRVYVRATVSITDGNEKIEVTGFARESLDKKGMDASQITGSASSYARKYALNGMFLIDDTKDADTNEYVSQTTPKKVEQEMPCPKCGTEMAIRDGQYGQFWGCPKYKDCGQRPINISEA